MIIIDELPFSHVENEGFLQYIHYMCPRAKIPSRITIARSCIEMYLDEMKKLKKILKKCRICITTDTWTSLQNINYMCVTAHYIDDGWKLRKKIINFLVVPNHRGETIGKMLEKCLLEWEVGGLMTVTCDNASSNNVAIAWLKKKTKGWDGVMLAHDYLHVRCSAHILNLIVKDGLKKFDASIYRIREAVRYVRSSPSRWAMWNECVKKEKIESKKHVCFDVATRWNSTYNMLSTALLFEKAFMRLEEDQESYRQHFQKNVPDYDSESEDDPLHLHRSPYISPPMEVDWAKARLLEKFLEVFYKTTLKLSGSHYVTSDLLFGQLATIKKKLDDVVNALDMSMKTMGEDMMAKFVKYCDLDKINPILLCGVVLDPRCKFAYVQYHLKIWYGDPHHSSIMFVKDKIKQTLVRLYDWHVIKNPNLKVPSACGPSGSGTVDSVDEVNFFHYLDEGDEGSMSEVEKYLQAPILRSQDAASSSFEVLNWWKNNSGEYPILSLVARDVLAIPVSSVASESAFSTSGRLLDSFRTSLRPYTVEALVCTQSWIRIGKAPIDILESMEEIEKLDDLDGEMLDSVGASSSLSNMDLS